MHTHFMVQKYGSCRGKQMRNYWQWKLILGGDRQEYQGKTKFLTMQLEKNWFTKFYFGL